MLIGKSIFHVNQSCGKSFSKSGITGYYNDLTQKVLKEPELLHTGGLPIIKTATGDDLTFTGGVFQYGLGAYDLYLQTEDEVYLKKFKQCVEWASAKQQEDGGWDTFSQLYPGYAYSAMTQGEGVSLLARGYKEFQNEHYFEQCRKAIDFMLKPITEGGTARYDGEDVVLHEYTHLPAVLNGWIFALWGLYDWSLISGHQEDKLIYERVVKTIIKYLPDFDCKYWSMYDLGERITSPFYHKVHIAQMQAMYQLTGYERFDEFSKKWTKNLRSPLDRGRALIKKIWQKVVE